MQLRKNLVYQGYIVIFFARFGIILKKEEEAFRTISTFSKRFDDKEKKKDWINHFHKNG